MSKTIYRDFDEFSEAINGMAGRIVPTARAQFDWWVQVIPVGRVAMQQVQIGGAATFAGDGTDNALTLGIPISDSQRIRSDGDSMKDNSFILVKEGQPFTFAASQATRWAGITVPMDHALRVRQLGEIRIALLAADPVATSVTGVAARFGVWDFSSFARNYKALYGETPSTTLNRPASARDRRNALNESWIRFAARKFQH
jgi:hypothetical protein